MVFIANILTARQQLVVYTFTSCLRCSTRACTYTQLLTTARLVDKRLQMYIYTFTRRVRGGREREMEGERDKVYITYWRKIFIEPALNVGHGLAG